MQNEVEETISDLIKGGPYDPPSGPWEAKANVVLGGIAELKRSPDSDELDLEELMDELRAIVIHIVYAGVDPHEVPLNDIVYALENPVVDYPVSLKHRRSIKGPGRAIRTKCMECQGLQQAWVHDCPTINCALWPFRFGSNAFFGRLANVNEDEEIIDSEAEIEAMEAARVQPEQADGNS